MCSYKPAGSWTRLNHAKYLSEFAIADVTTSAIVVSRKRPLIEINHYGERLIALSTIAGGRPGDATLPLQFEDDLEADGAELTRGKRL